MNRLKSLRVDLILLIVIACGIIFCYWNLPSTFFQQDEWYGFSVYNNIDKIGGIGYFLKEVFLTFGKTHYSPLTEVGDYLQYRLFGLHFSLYAYVSIFTHIVNSILVFIFVKQLIKMRVVVFLITLLFAVNSISHQAVSWIGTSFNTQGSNLFSFIFYILIVFYIKNKEKDKKVLSLSLVSLLIGLLLKETVAAFLLAPFFYYFYQKEKNVHSAKRFMTPFVVFLFTYLTLRLIMYFSAPPLFASANVELHQAGIPVYIYRAIVLPFRVVAQSLIPARYLLSFSEVLIRLSYPQYSYTDGSVDAVIRETAGYDIICIFISLIIFFAAFFSYRFYKMRNETFSKGITLFLLITIISPLLIIFIPGKAGYVSLIEPRDLYAGSFGAEGLLVLTLFGFLSWVWKEKAKGILIILVISLSVMHAVRVRADINQLEVMGTEIQYLLTKISATYPHLPQKVVFYTQSDKAYYGLPDNEKILPVEVGFGGMLLDWYDKNENFPACFYATTQFLDILGQGYKECEGRGFGYFRNITLLETSMKANILDPSSIVAFSYSSSNGELKNITQETRLKMQKLLSTK